MKTQDEFEMLVHVYLAQRHATEALQWAGGHGGEGQNPYDLRGIQALCAAVIERSSEENQRLAFMQVVG
jgi:hypothetical protein